MKRQSSWRVALLLAVGLVSAAFAQEAPKAAPEAAKAAPAAAKPALMDRAATLAAAAEVTKAKYPDADDVLVDDFIFVRYEADGTSVTFDETWTKVLTEKGRRDNERMSLDFDEAYSKVALDLLEVIKPDGTAVPVDVAAQSRVTTESGQMSENIYDPNRKVLEVGIPGLAVGDIVHYRAIHTTFKARVPNTWSDWTELESHLADPPLPLRGLRPEGTPAAQHRAQGPGARHGDVLEVRAGRPPPLSLGGARRAAHVRGAEHAADLHLRPAPAGQHHRRLARNLEVVLADQPAAPARRPTR